MIQLIVVIPEAGGATVFGVVGDWGTSGANATNVANMVTSTDWDTDYIITLGDNNYGGVTTGHSDWESIVGARYGDYIQQRAISEASPYPTQTSITQRFFPTIGNHDITGGSASGHIDYFHDDPDNPSGRLPAGVHNSSGSYYDVELPIENGTGSVRLFAMDSELFHADTDARAAQTVWLQQGLASSTATWNFVYVHRAPYSSSSIHGGDTLLQLPFQRWGADAVLAGHNHIYERLRVTDSTQNEMLYFVNGVGGRTLYPLGIPAAGSEVRYNQNHGAMRIAVTDQIATFEFLSLGDGNNGMNGGLVIDTFALDQSNLPAPPSSNADFDNDGFVDTQDLMNWQSDYGAGNGADADGDLDSDGTDFLAWQRQFDGDFANIQINAIIPEPSTVPLTMLCMSLLSSRSRRSLT
ncbi:metallophosphoesterase [Adhaeretor mobilis]|nr:metallophosphoesterase [Adhaeretor mobilis]